MTRDELKERMKECLLDPWDARSESFKHITIDEAKSWLLDIYTDQGFADLEENERIPLGTDPHTFMEIWNEICNEHYAKNPPPEDDECEDCDECCECTDDQKRIVVDFMLFLPETEDEVTLTVPESMTAGDVCDMLRPLLIKGMIGYVTKRLED